MAATKKKSITTEATETTEKNIWILYEISRNRPLVVQRAQRVIHSKGEKCPSL
jgi:hypothetical protein